VSPSRPNRLPRWPSHRSGAWASGCRSRSSRYASRASVVACPIGITPPAHPCRGGS
jgi:hypothetical protein